MTEEEERKVRYARDIICRSRCPQSLHERNPLGYPPDQRHREACEVLTETLGERQQARVSTIR